MFSTGKQLASAYKRQGLAIALALLLCGCAGGGGGGGDGAEPVSTPEAFDYFAMFVNLADNLVIPNYEALAAESTRLAEADGVLAGYCQALGSGDESAAREDARAGWRDAMLALQATELHQLGPVTADEGALHNRLITPPETRFSTCGVDQSVVLSREDDFDLDTRLPNQKGMKALEYLLFNDDLAHTCPAQIPETADWNERSELQRKQWRCDHALLLAADVATAAETIREAWPADGGNFRAEFAHPDNHEARLEELSDALFYIEKEVKDRKLGEPLGLHVNCSQAACPDRVESPWSEHSLANIQANLQAFRALFTGGDGLSFDDLIAAQGLRDIADDMLAEVDAALARAEAISDSLIGQAEAILSDGSSTDCANSAANPDGETPLPACALHGLAKRLTDSLRTDFVTAVNLDVPDRVQSDND